MSAQADLLLGKTLSDREASVTRCVAEGLATKDICVRLGCSEKSLDNCVQRIYKKTGVHSRRALAEWALQNLKTP
jgi:DNA-binding CsgD family transcriptional regulator